MTTLVEKLVNFASATTFESLPPDAIDESKRILLDCVGCSLAALSVDKGKRAVSAAREMGGPPQAKVIGSGDTLSLSAAAFANGELINALDFDVTTIPPGHVSPYVVPAILAVGEHGQSSGKDLISALSVAHEVSARFGPAMAYYRDLKPGEKVAFPPVMGYSSTIFGGTLGVGMLRRLSSERLAHALGLAGHLAPAQAMTKWARTLPATDDKYLLSGWMGQAELLAVTLSEQGYRGDIEVLEGEYGFWRFMGSTKWNPDALTDELGDAWRFPKATIYKPYPTCRITHTALDCLTNLMAVNDLRTDEIEHVTAYCDPHAAALPMWSNTTIVSPGDAQMNVAYAISMVVHGVKAGPEWHDDSTMRDERVLAFMKRVTLQPHPEFERSLMQDPQSRIGSVVVQARGTTYHEERRFRKGSPATAETRMSDEELVRKFMHNASRILTSDKAGRIADIILHLDGISDLSKLTHLW
ncbi:MmgE/PrpD family protein [Paraburkholderia sp. MM5384-R2]|uniref:MmgE/PrpD family protein n=1 Tax=Paraburkholderia sp. MM5384-R2 TaxID=2723097 RepID=UPI00160757A9|nr:MmgE/PrpD family protein [Paraburkholderia sp. MM5384-R2]MBB5498835.1 2-methylcitrate dehydratase PrpD [Paraburkholderia sp. MM5384-R2]